MNRKQFLTLLFVASTLAWTLIAQPASAQAGQPSDYLTDIRQAMQQQWPHNRTINLVFHGHSVPSGYANTPNVRTLQAYPHQVLHAVKEAYPYAVINVITTGIGGENSTQGVKRFEKEVLTHRPDVLFIDYALNDRAIGLEKAKAAWEKMIGQAQERGIKVILLTPTPDTTEDILDDNAPLQKHSEQIRELARRYRTGLVDSYAAFKEKRKNGEDLHSYMSQSNHPNEKGHAVVKELILRYFLDARQQREYRIAQALETLGKVADWQLMNFETQVRNGSRWPSSHAYWAWTNATLYTGMAEWAKLSGEQKYWDFLLTACARNNWQTGPNPSFADDICIVQPYALLYEKYRKPEMIGQSIRTLQQLIRNTKDVSLSYTAEGANTRWCWSDALFMAPTSFARIGKITGDRKYFDFMDKEFHATCDTLYSPADKLFFRDTRYKAMREENGEKVFWGRGNGWVTAGLTVIIDNLPADYPSRSFYIDLFKEMMAKIAALQDRRGFWHPSLLDTAAYPSPESSASGFFTYCLFWGINHGYLDEGKYLPAAEKAWQALLSVVHDDGKVGYVQAIGADPKKVDSDETEVYGTGAFLMAGTEYVEYLKANRIQVDMDRLGLTFEGFGALSAGASSRLLADYPEPYRSDILDFLFKPGFGASLQHFKFEIGGDMNSTCGTEPSHARTREEMLHPHKTYFTRGYEGWMAVEARKRNPEMVFDVLQWGAPGWFEGGFYSQDNADYVASYIKGMKKYLGIDVRHCGLWNEKHVPELSRNYVVNNLRPTLDRKGLKQVKITGNDMYCNFSRKHEPWSYVDELLKDGQLRKCIGVLGYHYIDGQSPEKAQSLGIPVWESEASIGTGSWEEAYSFARLSNLNYIRGRVTKTIVWCPVDAYYNNLNHHHYGIMQTNSPWSGHYIVRPAVWAFAHTTQFAAPGWRYVDSGCGITPAGSPYVTLSEDKSGKKLSMVIVTGKEKETFRITFAKCTPGKLAVWKSDKTEQFVRLPSVLPSASGFTVELEPLSIYTLTTTEGQQKGVARNPVPERKDFPQQYAEDFESYRPNQMPRYITDQGGAFEVKTDTANRRNQVLQQVITRPLICWDEWGPNNPEPFTEFGDTGYGDYEVSTDYRMGEKGTAKLLGHVTWFESNTAPHGIGIIVDEQGNWQLIENQTAVATGKADVRKGQWNTLKLSFRNGMTQAYVNQALVVERPISQSFQSGLAGMGCDWSPVQFDNLKFNLYQ